MIAINIRLCNSIVSLLSLISSRGNRWKTYSVCKRKSSHGGFDSSSNQYIHPMYAQLTEQLHSTSPHNSRWLYVHWQRLMDFTGTPHDLFAHLHNNKKPPSWCPFFQDGTFSVLDFCDEFLQNEVQRVLRAYADTISIDIHCAQLGHWSSLPDKNFTKLCKIRINPVDVLDSGDEKLNAFIGEWSPAWNHLKSNFHPFQTIYQPWCIPEISIAY